MLRSILLPTRLLVGASAWADPAEWALPLRMLGASKGLQDHPACLSRAGFAHPGNPLPSYIKAFLGKSEHPGSSTSPTARLRWSGLMRVV